MTPEEVRAALRQCSESLDAAHTTFHEERRRIEKEIDRIRSLCPHVWEHIGGIYEGSYYECSACGLESKSKPKELK